MTKKSAKENLTKKFNNIDPEKDNVHCYIKCLTYESEEDGGTQVAIKVSNSEDLAIMLTAIQTAFVRTLVENGMSLAKALGRLLSSMSIAYQIMINDNLEFSAKEEGDLKMFELNEKEDKDAILH